MWEVVPGSTGRNGSGKGRQPEGVSHRNQLPLWEAGSLSLGPLGVQHRKHIQATPLKRGLNFLPWGVAGDINSMEPPTMPCACADASAREALSVAGTASPGDIVEQLCSGSTCRLLSEVCPSFLWT